MGENPSPARVLVLWAGRCGRLLHAFHAVPGWVSGCGKLQTRGSLRSLGLIEDRNNRFSVLGIPDTTGYCGRAENKVRALGATRSAPELKGEWSRGIRHSVAPRM